MGNPARSKQVDYATPTETVPECNVGTEKSYSRSGYIGSDWAAESLLAGRADGHEIHNSATSECLPSCLLLLMGSPESRAINPRYKVVEKPNIFDIFSYR